jgi:hypothetical protein
VTSCLRARANERTRHYDLAEVFILFYITVLIVCLLVGGASTLGVMHDQLVHPKKHELAKCMCLLIPGDRCYSNLFAFVWCSFILVRGANAALFFLHIAD